MRTILIDLSQFSNWPARTGIQRVLGEMLRHWPQQVIRAEIGIEAQGAYAIAPTHDAAVCFEHLFSQSGTENPDDLSSADIRAIFTSRAVRSLDVSELAGSFDGYLLPEPTFRAEILETAELWNRLRPAGTFAILYDALLQTNPAIFPASPQSQIGRYFRLIAEMENVACISGATLGCLETRLRRRPLPNGIALDLGCESLGEPMERRAAAVPTFVALGTVEPRKNHEMIVEAFRRLWSAGRNYKLVIVGAPGWHHPDFIGSLRQLGRDEAARFTWLEAAGDPDIARLLSTATAAIFVSELEGYGLPAVEALAAGCPLIASGSLPALAGLPAGGQARLRRVTVDAIMAAADDLAEPSRNQELSAAVARLRLPTWRHFTHSLAEWIDGTLSKAESGGAELGRGAS